MKPAYKIIVLFLLVLSGTFFNELHAQGLRIGAKAGANASWLKGDYSGDFFKEVKAGYHFGLYGTIHLGFIGIQPEVLFSSKGNNHFDNSEMSLNLNYFDIPVLLQIWIMDRFSIYAGPQFGFNISAKLEENDGKVESDFNDNIKLTDFGALAGMAYEFDSGIRIYARYNSGILNIDNADMKTLQNSVIQAGIGYSFVNAR